VEDQSFIANLAQAALAAMRAGRMDEAAHTWDQILARAPEHAQALLYRGQIALLRKDVAGATALLERAAEAAPREPAIVLNMAFACRAAGDLAGEAENLERALTLDPYFFPALLAKGAMLERAGHPRSAAQVYRNAIKIAPPEERVPPDLRGALQHARQCVEADNAALSAHLEARVGPLRSGTDDANLARFDECAGIAAGRKKVYTSDPVMLYYPRLPAITYFEESLFPWLGGVEAATEIIRAEFAAAAMAEGGEFSPYVNHPDSAPLNQWAELNRSPRWSAYFLWKDGVRHDAHCAQCPETARILETLPLLEIDGFAPTAFFSLLQPHTRIPPHTGSTNTRLTVHVPLIVPDGCAFRVGNDVREWRPGAAWVFDDTIEHEAWNNSDKPRAILIFDIWNPLLSAAERELFAALLIERRTYYAGG
jgi:aspartyl/asparaginyl beta-hydroxylase (cupin superfamily)